ncbi:MAG: hypothetical protein IT378_16875 [Sandaracinaceae bacterium]|nr:hypothetical protein [Sandaracinaceae bacterium]
MSRWILALIVLAHVPLAGAQENTAPACSNGADDDRDGAPDCSDLECRYFVFCAQAQPGSVAPPVPQAAPQGSATGYEGAYARAREAWFRQTYGYVPAAGAGMPGYGPSPGAYAGSYGGTHPAWAIVAVGLTTFAAFWVADWAMTIPLASGSPNGGGSIGVSFVPLAGPFIQLAFGPSGLMTALLITFGVGQLTGLVLTIVGLAVQEPDGPAPFALAPWLDGQSGGLIGAWRF